jgi:anti-anti-sigma regulatory factor
VVIDLTELVSIAPTVLDILVGQLRRLRDEDAITACLVGPADQLRQTLDISDLDRVCALHSTVDGAVSALQ